jgi:heptosyltransferase II
MENILVIRFSSLGDVVMASAVVEALRRKFPRSHITMLTRAVYAPVFKRDRRIDVLMGIPAGKTPFQITGMLGGKYSAVVDLHGSLRSRIVASLLKSPLKLTVKKHSLSRRLMILSRNRFRRKFDTLGSYLEILEPLGIITRILPCLKPGEDALEAAGKLLEKIGNSDHGKLIGLAPGSQHRMKRWPEDSWARLADNLQVRGDIPVFIGDNADQGYIDAIRGMMKRDVASLAGCNLSLTIGIISRLDGLVTNDSGPMHIAGALGIPFAALFGPTHPDLGFVPGYPYGAVLHSGIPCSPCSVHGQTPCRLKKRKCMEAITPESALNDLDGVMKEKEDSLNRDSSD